jgi:hypothetical protein
MADPTSPPAPESEGSGAQKRQAWFMGQRFRPPAAPDAATDVEVDPPDEPLPDLHDQPEATPPDLAALMHEYRVRLQDALDAAADPGPAPDPAPPGPPAGP